LSFAHPGVDHRQLDVAERADPGDQVEGLEHESDLAVSDIGQLVSFHAAHVHSIEQVAAMAGQVQAAKDVHQGRLARPAGAHDGDEIAALDAQRDVP
jgi:hypothetical protein